MTQDEEVRLLDVAAELVLGPLADESVESINALGGWLAQMTRGDREQVEKGERWGRGSRALSPEEGKKALRGMTLDQLDAFATRLGHGRDEVISGAMGYSEIHGGVLWALGDSEEMAKITGGER
jgi:hypothetical protein